MPGMRPRVSLVDPSTEVPNRSKAVGVRLAPPAPTKQGVRLHCQAVQCSAASRRAQRAFRYPPGTIQAPTHLDPPLIRRRHAANGDVLAACPSEKGAQCWFCTVCANQVDPHTTCTHPCLFDCNDDGSRTMDGFHGRPHLAQSARPTPNSAPCRSRSALLQVLSRAFSPSSPSFLLPHHQTSNIPVNRSSSLF